MLLYKRNFNVTLQTLPKPPCPSMLELENLFVASTISLKLIKAYFKFTLRSSAKVLEVPDISFFQIFLFLCLPVRNIDANVIAKEHTTQKYGIALACTIILEGNTRREVWNCVLPPKQQIQTRHTHMIMSKLDTTGSVIFKTTLFCFLSAKIQSVRKHNLKIC